MKKINLFSRLWSSGGNSQGSDVGFDRRFTVGSPSFHRRSTMLKLVSVLVLILTIGSGNVWGADPVASATPTSGNSYVVAVWTGSKYYALPNIETSSSTYDGTEVAVNGSGQVTTASAPVWKFTVNPSNSNQFYLTYKSGNTTYYLYKNGTGNSNKNISSQSGSQIYWTFTAGTGGNAGKYSVKAERGSYHYILQYESSKWKVTGTTASYSIILLEVAPAGPTITTSSSMTTFGCNMSTGVPIKQSFTVSGTALINNVTVTPPSGYEVCLTENGTYTSSVELSKGSGTLSSTTVYVKLKDDNAAGSYSGNISCVSSGATTRNVAVSGSTPFKVTWKANGSTYATTYVAYASGEGTAIGTLPDDPDAGDYCGDVFYGWYDGASYAHASVAPSIIGTSTKITSDKTYVAVFADEKDGGTTTVYKLVSSLTNAKDYVFVTRNTAGSGYALSSSVTTGTSVTITTSGDDKIVSGTPANTIIWAAATGWNLQNKNTSTYLVINGGSFGLNASAGTLYWSTDYGLYGKSGSGKTSYYVQCSTGTFSKSESGSTTNRVWAYEKTTISVKTHTNFKTTCCSDPGLAYATGSVTKTYGASAFTNPLTNSHSVGVTYDSSDKTVATVDSEGEITILKAGTTTITATFAGNATYCADDASYTLTVNKASISPTLSYESGTLVIGNNSSSPTVGGNSGSGTVTYAITTESTSGVVTLNTSTGVVTAAKEGTATITATIPATTNYNGGSATANFTVTCGAPSSVDISGNYQFYPGETISLTATPTGGAGTPVTYQWKKGGSPIAGATSATYTKNNATASDAGAYTCTVQYGSNCATTSDAFNLKCMQFYLKTSGGADISNHALTKVDATHATLSLSLTGGTTYKFRVTDGCGNWFGNSGEMTSSNCTNWAMDADADCRVTTSSKSATYVFNFDFSGGLLGSEMKVSVVYPSSNQASGKVIYWDNEVNKWNGSKLWYRIGKSTHNSNTQLSKVAGTANFYSVTTSQYDGFEYWHIANNVGQGTGNIFWTKDNSGSGLEITNAMGFEGAPVTDATVTVTPTTTHSTGGSSDNNNCEFYTYSITSGIKSYTVTSSATNCTVAMEKYNNDAGSSTTALASGGTVMPTQYVKVTVTPNTGYQFSSVSVTNGTTVTAAAAGTPGVYYITGNATVTATCTVKSCTVNFDKNSGTGGDASTTATYGSAMTTVTAPTRTGYTFDGYWDAETDNDGSGTQYYLANGTSARDWDKDVTAAQTLYAKWNAKQYTIELDREGAASGATSVTATFNAGTLAGWSAPSKTGYTFGGYWSDDNGTGTLVISTSGVLQNSVTISAVNWTDASGHWIKDGGVTVYAKWTAEQYTITYKDQGNVAYSGSNGGSLPTTHTYGAVTALVDGVKSGYRFDGWFDNSGCTGSAITTIGGTDITANTTYYAKWTQVYTVTWHVNGDEWSSGVVSGNTQVPGGTKVSALPTAPTKSDCDDSKVFVGWKAAEIDGVSVSDPGGIFSTQGTSPTINANMDFYAVFADESGGDFTRVTNVATQIEAGKKVIMGYEATANSGVIIPIQSASFGSNILYPGTTLGSAGTGTIDMSELTYEGSANYAFTIHAGYTSGYFAFEQAGDEAGKYIGHNGKNAVAQYESIGDDTKADFSITLGANDVASIVNKYGNDNTTKDGSNYYNFKYLRYNSANDRVAIYRTGQADMVLYLCNPLTYSNYVTSCSSCDADATFTNTTPAVSEIGCTSATLTATGGLATVGADGCHVSDYGFVIGTSDNPAVGGVGVTKLQVGTSDPTIGADFSYDATGLTKGTHYYIRAYATNRHGTAYSSSTNFWTKNVSSIAITTAPTKTNYLVGETFDATGMVVTATMADSNTEDVTSDVTYSTSALTAGTSQNFAINYSLCETDKSVNQAINVYTLTVTEGTNPSYGVASGSVNIVSITGLGEHKTYTVTVTSSNATAVDNGDNTWTITNPTGNVAVRVDYADAVQVKVYYKVDGVTVTGLTQDVYQSETTTLPTASELATAMAAQSMDIPDDDYPNFYGWSETEFPAQTAEPTIVTGTPTINAEKTYYAVYTNINKKSITPSAFSGTYASNDGENTIDGVKYEVSNICTQSSKIQFRSSPGYLYSKGALAYIKKIEITGLDLIVNACSDNAGTLDGDAITPTGSGTYVYTFPASKQYFKIKGKGGTDKVSLIEIFYANATVYYMTQFCATKVNLTHNSPEHGTVAFGRSSLATCGSDKNVSLTITPDVGYQLTGWTVNTASGYADAKTTNPAVVTTNNNSAAQNITLTFAQDANKNYDVTATFGLMTVESWTWTYNSAAMPNPLNLYIGQSARLDVAYTPAGVDNSKKTYTRTKEDAYINWVGAAQATYSTISGKASTGENTTEVTFTHADGPTTTVNVKVLPLPAVHFADIVHNVSFDDVVATLSENILSPTKTTPTHADFDGSTLNTCEEQHLHLVGWIREDWPSLVTYLNGGAQPSTSDITSAGNDASGNAYFFTPGASINTQTFNGVTFYAVWAKVE